jgi:hypothetical protein
VSGMPSDPMNPPQLTREDRWVAGCSCGGLQWHAEGCTLFAMDRETALAAIADAEAVVRAHTDWLNTIWRAFEETMRRG